MIGGSQNHTGPTEKLPEIVYMSGVYLAEWELRGLLTICCNSLSPHINRPLADIAVCSLCSKEEVLFSMFFLIFATMYVYVCLFVSLRNLCKQYSAVFSIETIYIDTLINYVKSENAHLSIYILHMHQPIINGKHVAHT